MNNCRCRVPNTSTWALEIRLRELVPAHTPLSVNRTSPVTFVRPYSGKNVWWGRVDPLKSSRKTGVKKNFDLGSHGAMSNLVPLTPTEPEEVAIRTVTPQTSDPLMTFLSPATLTSAERGTSVGCFRETDRWSMAQRTVTNVGILKSLGWPRLGKLTMADSSSIICNVGSHKFSGLRGSLGEIRPSGALRSEMRVFFGSSSRVKRWFAIHPPKNLTIDEKF